MQEETNYAHRIIRDGIGLPPEARRPSPTLSSKLTFIDCSLVIAGNVPENPKPGS
jgi:hypothetical protein